MNLCTGNGGTKGRVYVDGVYIGNLIEISVEHDYDEYEMGTFYDPSLTRVRRYTTSTATFTVPYYRHSTRPGWRDYFLGFAVSASARAECTRRKVGAVIVKDKRTIGTGYNGAPKGAKKTCLTGDCPRAKSGVQPDSSYDTGPGACIAVHAEANAIIDAGRRNCTGATMYLTDKPCDGCLKLIKAAGIKKVVWFGGQLTKEDLYG